MSKIVPFRALRPKKEFAPAVASFPYDVMNLEEAKRMAADNRLSFLHVERSEVDVPPEAGYESDLVYETARDNLRRFAKEGILFQDRRPCFYVYRQIMEGREQYGIVACISAAEYERGLIKKHELTRADKERDRIRHVDTVGAQTGPVFIAYHARPDINSLVAATCQQKPEYDFVAADGIAHTVWVIAEEEVINQLIESFGKVEALYIADGHHRAAAGAAVAKKRREANGRQTGDEEYNYILAVLFPHDQLHIMDYNRAVKDLHGLSRAEFLGKVRVPFRCEKGFAQRSPSRLHEFGMYLEGLWYRLEATAPIYEGRDAVESLDVSILQRHVLGPLLGIGDPRTDKRIEFIGGIRGMAELEKLVDQEGFAIAFSLYPTDLEQLMAVADQGLIMPPKSTWFEPKLRSGLFVHLID
ncbi:MAG: DUF1015 family protein [Smithellaceae bacterium]|nr:DUF1015 family protein [Smithellaceae bacterium]